MRCEANGAQSFYAEGDTKTPVQENETDSQKSPHEQVEPPPVHSPPMTATQMEQKLLSSQDLESAILNTAIQVQRDYPRFFSLPDGLDTQALRKYEGTTRRHFEYFSRKFPSMLMNVASRCPHLEVRQEILRDCFDEEVHDWDTGKFTSTPPEGISHREVLYRDCEKLGVSREEVDSTEPTPIVFACVHALDNLTRLLSWQAAYMAVAVTELHSHPTVKAAVGGRISRDRRSLERLGLREGDLIGGPLHEMKDKVHGGGEIRLIIKYSDTPEMQGSVIDSARQGLTTFNIMRREIHRVGLLAVGLPTDGLPV